MASEENHNLYPEDDLDEDVDDSEEDDQGQQLLDDEDDDVLFEDNDEMLEEDEDITSISSPDPTIATVVVFPPPIATASGSGSDPKCVKVEETPIASSVVPVEKRQLFQRLWIDEDEIELLRGFLEFKTQHHHQDTAVFYDQIKSKLQLDFNKSQLAEKLRRLKKKYKTAATRIDSGKYFAFKTPHDRASFDISSKIWNNSDIAETDKATGMTTLVLHNDAPNPNSHPNTNLNLNISTVNNHIRNGVGNDANSVETKVQRSRKRSRVKIEEPSVTDNKGIASVSSMHNSSITTGLIEETLKKCLSPLFKELLNSTMNMNTKGFAGGVLNPIPLNFEGSSKMLGCEEKWRKQQILELEVYSKRLELVQDQIKVTLEELRSATS